MNDHSFSQSKDNRRSFLKLAALGAIGLAAVSMFRGTGSQKSLGKVRSMPLPGNGSIFEPRHDARLESWLRNGGK